MNFSEPCHVYHDIGDCKFGPSAGTSFSQSPSSGVADPVFRSQLPTRRRTWSLGSGNSGSVRVVCRPVGVSPVAAQTSLQLDVRALAQAHRYCVATFDRISRRNWSFRYLAGIRRTFRTTLYLACLQLGEAWVPRGKRESLDVFQAVVTRFTAALLDEHVTRDRSRRLRLGRATLCADLPHTAVLE